MGFLNKDEKWQHITEEGAKKYLHLFREYNQQTGAKWHRYVDSEHVKGIAEKGLDQFYIFRSLFRSVAQYSSIAHISPVHWWVGYLFMYDVTSNDFILQGDSTTLGDNEFRQQYRACGGCSNF